MPTHWFLFLWTKLRENGTIRKAIFMSLNNATCTFEKRYCKTGKTYFLPAAKRYGLGILHVNQGFFSVFFIGVPCFGWSAFGGHFLIPLTFTLPLWGFLVSLLQRGNNNSVPNRRLRGNAWKGLILFTQNYVWSLLKTNPPSHFLLEITIFLISSNFFTEVGWR